MIKSHFQCQEFCPQGGDVWLWVGGGFPTSKIQMKNSQMYNFFSSNLLDLHILSTSLPGANLDATRKYSNRITTAHLRRPHGGGCTVAGGHAWQEKRQLQRACTHPTGMHSCYIFLFQNGLQKVELFHMNQFLSKTVGIYIFRYGIYHKTHLRVFHCTTDRELHTICTLAFWRRSFRKRRTWFR